MSSVVLRLSAPLMSFADQSRFANRHTAPDPTVSAIQGLLAAAAGTRRGQPWPAWITDVDLAIRADRPGRPMKDFHTVNPPDLSRYRFLSETDRDQVRTVRTVEGGRRKDPILSDRWYLTDAAYLVVIHDPTGNVTDALSRPRWALYAGRKSCPLTAPFLLGTTPASPVVAAEELPSPRRDDERHRDLLTRDVTLLSAPATDTPVSRREVRNDRASGFRRHAPQDRWHVRVTVPAAGDWFDVIDHLGTRSVA